MSLFPLDSAEDKKVSEVGEKKPPSTLAEFLAAEGLDDWPLPMTLEGPLDIQSEGLFIGNQDDIAEILKEAAPLGLHMMDEMEDRLSALEDKINFYADRIVTDDKRPSRLAERLFHSPSRTFITEVSESDAVKSHRSSKGHKSVDLVDTMLETRKRSLDYYTFPGFVHGEFIELPAQLEAPPILHRVTTAQDFNPGFRKFWKKLFLSEASSAVMQDAFWWIFLDHFKKQEDFQEDKDCLFDRISDSYVALFTSINTDVKDKFLSVYPDCLAQALFCTYRESFPESKWRFSEEFKQYLVNLVYEWVTGLRPVPGVWKAWNEEGLEGSQTSRDNETAKKMLEAAALHKKVELSLDMDGFSKVLDKLGTESFTSPQGNILREVTKSSNRLLSRGRSQLNKQESHQIGPGPDYERVKFNTSGRSPLISHYLHMRQLRSYKQPGKKVRRTEIMKLPPEGPTYQQFIASTISKADSLSREYSRLCDQTSADILDLERKKRDTNKQINSLKKALSEAKSLQERRTLMDKIIEFKESGQKEMPLLEQQSSRSETSTEDSYDYDD
ncbi:protein FAM227B isoform X2 [Aplysia californica]|nr:protein FAM227B isoform X2 [Aplysia californica]